MNFEHMPVLLEECMALLAPGRGGIFIDGTLGGGGHALEMLKRLPEGAVIGIDRDLLAIGAARERIEREGPFRAAFSAVHGNFHDVKAILASLGISSIEGALLDLGVSSPQLDEGARGFSYHEDAKLDMRMDRTQAVSAYELVNFAEPNDLVRIIRDYGEEKWAVQIVRVLADRRKTAPIETTAQLVGVIDAAIPARIRSKDASHPARRTFQALRIAVNDELAPLETALMDFASLLKPDGRLAVISFHSLEDRIVKNTFRSLENPCTCPKNMPVCVCGRKREAVALTRKPVTASEEELKINPRARSASLRAVLKVESQVLGGRYGS